jgi:hypothetical protein
MTRTGEPPIVAFRSRERRLWVGMNSWSNERAFSRSK